MGVFDNVKDIGKIKQATDEAKKQMEMMKATGLSKRGFVKVSLDGEKNIKNLEFSDEFLSQPKEEMVKLVKEAHKIAAKEIDKQLKKQMKNSSLAQLLSNNKG